MKVALFITCFNDTLFPDVGIATTRLLERLGLIVDFPEAQTCCGQMHYNTGYQRETIPLLRHFARVFHAADVIVAPSASCVGMVRDLYPKAAALSGDRTLIEEVEQLIQGEIEMHLQGWQPPGSAQRRPEGAAQHPDQRPVADLLPLARRRRL